MPNFHYFGEILVHQFVSKKTAAECHSILVEVYGVHYLLETSCTDWFQRFKSGNFDLSNKDRGKTPEKLEDTELHALLDEDSTQTLKQLGKKGFPVYLVGSEGSCVL